MWSTLKPGSLIELHGHGIIGHYIADQNKQVFIKSEQVPDKTHVIFLGEENFLGSPDGWQGRTHCFIDYFKVLYQDQVLHIDCKEFKYKVVAEPI